MYYLYLISGIYKFILYIIGGGTTHTTNMVLLQPEINKDNSDTSSHANVKLKIPDYKTRKSLHMERTSINPYKTFGRGNPSPVQIDTSIAYDNYQRKSMFSHAILRFCTANPDEIQPIGA